MQIFHNANYDFIRWRWHALILSSVVIIGGLALALRADGMPLGIDFSGGTLVVVQFEQPVTEDAVRNGARRAARREGRAAVRRPGAARDPDPAAADAERRSRASASRPSAQQAIAAHREGRTSASSRSLSTRGRRPGHRRGPAEEGHLRDAGLDRRHHASTSRCRSGSSSPSARIVATFHDIFVTLALLAFFGYELSLNVVAAILTITGYSVNDTIVIFDRVRENLRG